MARFRWGILVIVFHIALGSHISGAFGVTDVAIVVSPAVQEIPERCPFVVTVAIENRSDADVRTILDIGSPTDLRAATFLTLRALDGTEYSIHCAGTPQANVYRLPSGKTLSAGSSITFDRVFLPISWGRINERSRYQYAYVEPGTYVGQIAINYDVGHNALSNEFAVTIVSLSGEGGLLCNNLPLELAPFLVGGEPPGQASGEAREALELLLKNQPDSLHARWVRFWKVYHHGTEEEALAYARQHADFPLSDNLMFRVAQHVANDDSRHDDAVALLAELERVFPDGDAAFRAKAVREELLAKKKP